MTTGDNSHKESAWQSGGKALYIILGAALILRILNLIIVSGSDLVRMPIIDAKFYHKWAVSISQGNFLGDHTFFMSPLYPYFMGLIYAIVGVKPLAVMFIQALMGVAIVYLIYVWAFRITDRKTALTASALASLYAPFIFYEVTLLTATLIILLSVTLLVSFERSREDPAPKYLWITGILIGLSALARPLVLLFVPALYLLILIEHRKDFIKKSVILTAGVIIILLPVSIRNLIVGGDFTLTTSSAGMNFYVGNNSEATGLYWEAPFLTSIEPEYEDEDYRRVAAEALGSELTTSEAGSYWFNEAMDDIIHHPLGYMGLLVRKVFYFWNRAEFANNVSFYMGKTQSPVIGLNPISFWLIAPFGLGGLILLWRRYGFRRVSLLWLWLLTYLAGNVIFFVASEYRLPAVLPLLIGFAYLLVTFVDHFKSGKHENAMRALLTGLIFLPLCNFRTDFIRDGENARMDWFNYGNTLLGQGNYNGAIKRLEKSVAIDPFFAEGLLRLAEAYSRDGQTDKALEIGKQAGLEDPNEILKIVEGEALREAYSLLNEGKFKEALDEFGYAGVPSEEAVAETTRAGRLIQAQKLFFDEDLPGALDVLRLVRQTDKKTDPAISTNIAYVQWQLGEHDSAEFYASEALERDSMNVEAIYLMNRLLNASGRSEEAEKLVRRIRPEIPMHNAMLLKARDEMDSLTALRKWEEALKAYHEYGRLGYDIKSEDKLRIGRLQMEVGNDDLAYKLLYEAELEGITTPDLGYYKARVLSNLNRPKEAVTEVQKTIAEDPDNVSARILLARLYAGMGKMDEAWRELDAVRYLKIIDPRLAEEYDNLVDSLKAK